jgi:hypothetical protein
MEFVMRKSATRKGTKVKTARIPLDGKIKVLVENPKRGEAAKRFGYYKDGMLVASYRKKVGEKQGMLDLRWDVNHKFVRVVASK